MELRHNSTAGSYPMISISNGIITGGTFTQQILGDKRHGFNILRDVVAPGAFHDSGLRFDPPKCHPNTRIAVISKIIQWILCQDPHTLDALILWLRGAAGAGKSAIAQTIAEWCFTKRILLASFFFSRSDTSRNHAGSLFATIAYQIALTLPQTRLKLAENIEHDPLIFTRSLSTQFFSLIVDPLQHLSDSGYFNHMDSPRLIIIDGLDECLNPKVQRQIQDVILVGIRQHRLPCIFLIASRPEQHILTRFNSADMYDMLTQLTLDESYLPDQDIEFFLRDKFNEISESHPFNRYLPIAWPTNGVIKYLVGKSSGQFIYASTVVKYVESVRHRPDRRLEAILNVRSAKGNLPFAELDALYNHLFSSVEDVSRVLQVIALDVFLSHQDSSVRSVQVIEEILLMEPGEVEVLFCTLSSIVTLRGTQLCFLHASLLDFLLDKSRSGSYFIGDPSIRTQLFGKCLQFLSYRDTSFRLHEYFTATLMAMRFIVSNYDQSLLASGLQEDVLSFSIACVHSKVKTDLVLFKYFNLHFLPKLFSALHNVENEAGHLYAHQLRNLNSFLGEHLKVYYGDMNLTLAVALVDFIIANQDLSSNSNLFINGHFSSQVVDRTHLHILYYPFDLECTPYLRLIRDYFIDPARSGEHLLDGAKYAMASLSCLYDIAEEQPVQTIFGFGCLSLLCLVYFLPRSSRSEDLVEYCRQCRFSQACSWLPNYLENAQEAIREYLERVDP